MEVSSATAPLFLQLMRIALGGAERFEVVPTPQEWEQLLSVAARQGVVGVAFSGVERLPREQRPPLDVLMDWSAVASRIERRNRRLNALSVQACHNFHHDGKRVCILKGQGVAALHPQPLRRTSGDIDVWMEGTRKEVVAYVRSHFPTTRGGDRGHHIATRWRGEELEVHFTPCRMFSLVGRWRMRRFYARVAPRQWADTLMLPEGPINVPTPQFNLVFLLAHLYHHWVFEGCGLKQFIDYYHLLHHVAGHQCAPGESLRNKQTAAQAMRDLDGIGLSRFAAAVMALLGRLGLDERAMLCAPDGRLGAALLDDVLHTGSVSASELVALRRRESLPRKFLRRLRRTARILPLAPRETICALLANITSWLLGRTG